MKNDELERVFAGLRAVETPDGLEGRVLRRLEARAEARRLAWGWGVGLAAAMVLVGVLGLRFGSFELGGGGHTPGAKALVLGGEVRPKAEALGYLQATATATADSSASLRNDNQRGEGPSRISESRHGAAGLVVFRAPGVRHGGGGLVAGLESFPAPPEPLTEQELLLRRIALAGSEPAFQLLNVETRRASMAASDAEFEAFVRPAPSGGRAGTNLDLQR